MDFLPQDYELPKSNSRYTKFEDGDTKIRILSSAIIGQVYFNNQNKPVRSKTPFTSTSDIKADGKVKEFWAFVVWNYNKGEIQLCELTQATIKEQIRDLTVDEDFGNPKDYDIKIGRKGKGIETEYNVKALAKSELANEIVEAYSSTPVNLEALYEGADPFTINI